MEPGNAAPPPTEDAKVHVEGTVSGQVAVGEHITQVGDIHGGELTIGQKVTNFIFGNAEERRAQRNRQAMLQLVRNTWIEGVLEQSLHGSALMELGLEERGEHDELLLLLDGLDEVREEHREACVQAINAFRGECGLTPLAICSRVADYDVLTGRLDLRGAVLLQPLKPEQVGAYLDRAGDELAAVREMWRSDQVFRELVESPLMLSVATLAYRGTEVEALRQSSTAEAHRKHLFDTYVERMFARPREGEPPCTQERAVHWLAWLA